MTTGFPSSKKMKVNEEFILLRNLSKMFRAGQLILRIHPSGKCDFYTEKVYIWDFAAGISLSKKQSLSKF